MESGKGHQPRRLAPDQVAERVRQLVASMDERGVPTCQIAQVLNRDESTIQRIRRTAATQAPPPG